MENNLKQQLAAKLIEAEEDLKPIESLTGTYPHITIEDAYDIQMINEQKKVQRGERIIGRKIGLTAKAMQDMFNVREPDYGFITDQMVQHEEVSIEFDSLIQPKIEAEMGFLLENDLAGPGLTNLDVIQATSGIVPVFEIIDSRIQNWQIKIQDTIADNASCGRVIMGSQVSPITDLKTAGMVLRKDGAIEDTAAGAAVMGEPALAGAWLGNNLAESAKKLLAGEVILAGALTAAKNVERGDVWEAEFSGIGNVRARFI